MSKTQRISAQEYRDSQSKGKTSKKKESVTTAPATPKKPDPAPELGIYFDPSTHLGPLSRYLGGTVEQHQRLHEVAKKIFETTSPPGSKLQ